MFIFCRLKINHESHEFILDPGTIANKYPPHNFPTCVNPYVANVILSAAVILYISLKILLKKDRYFKLLGVLIDENLTFNDNTDYLCKKLTKSIFIINQTKNFLSPKALKTLYFSLVHSTYYTASISRAVLYNLTSTALLNYRKKLFVLSQMWTPLLTRGLSFVILTYSLLINL